MSERSTPAAKPPTRTRLLTVSSDVPAWFIAAFEDGKDTAAFLAHYEVAMHHALEDVGIGFAFVIGNGRITPAGITYSPRDTRETD